MAWVTGATEELYQAPLFTMFANQKVEPPEKHAVLDIISNQDYGREIVSYDENGIATIKLPCKLIVGLTVYGDNARNVLFDLRNTLRSDKWSNYLTANGMGFEQNTTPRDITLFDETEYIEQAQMDLWFNIEWSTTEDRGWIETIGGSGQINSLSGTGDLGEITIDFSSTYSPEDE